MGNIHRNTQLSLNDNRVAMLVSFGGRDGLHLTQVQPGLNGRDVESEIGVIGLQFKATHHPCASLKHLTDHDFHFHRHAVTRDAVLIQ